MHSETQNHQHENHIPPQVQYHHYDLQKKQRTQHDQSFHQRAKYQSLKRLLQNPNVSNQQSQLSDESQSAHYEYPTQHQACLIFPLTQVASDLHTLKDPEEICRFYSYSHQ